MDKPIRKAVRCYLIKDNEVVVTKYKKGNKKEGYYDIPGGKIEEGESPKQTAIREMKEETGIEIQNLKYKGIMTIEYPDRLFIFDNIFSFFNNSSILSSCYFPLCLAFFFSCRMAN